jgi:hypothetical protein
MWRGIHPSKFTHGHVDFFHGHIAQLLHPLGFRDRKCIRTVINSYSLRFNTIFILFERNNAWRYPCMHSRKSSSGSGYWHHMHQQRYYSSTSTPDLLSLELCTRLTIGFHRWLYLVRNLLNKCSNICFVSSSPEVIVACLRGYYI